MPVYLQTLSVRPRLPAVLVLSRAMSGFKSYRSAFTPPQVACGKTADDVTHYPVDYTNLCEDTYSAVSGPDTGVDYVQTLRGNEDSSNNNANTTGEEITVIAANAAENCLDEFRQNVTANPI